jgi:arylsulfatase A-like enzyme
MEKFAHLEDIQRRILAAMLANLDDSVGAITAQIRTAGLDRQTMIYFISDNGGPTRELTSSNLPLRGEKGSLFEGGIRMPFMVQWPGSLPAGVTYDRPIITTDLFSTTLAAAGATNPIPSTPESVKLLPSLTGAAAGDPHENLFWRQGLKRALRQGNLKIVKPSPQTNWRLYDLAADLAETQDLATHRPADLADLVRAWEKLNAEMVEPAF